MIEDLYRILQVPGNADRKSIRRAYRKLAKRYHPDAGEGSNSDQFRSVQRAYDILGNPDSRAVYDTKLAAEDRTERYGPVAYPEHPGSRPAHIDLRNLRNRAEPIMSKTRGNPWDDFDELFELMDALTFGWPQRQH
jgi:curved DNA-binding protein CbpA